MDKIELKSENARRVLGQIPPSLFRMGIFSIAITFVVFIMIFSFLKVDPSVKVEVVIKNYNKNTVIEYILFPNNNIIISDNNVYLTFRGDLANILPKCKINFGNKFAYIKDSRVYMAIETNHTEEIKEYLITENDVEYVYGYVNLSRRSLLRWIFENVFYTNQLKI